MLSLEEKKKAHLEFMAAALIGFTSWGSDHEKKAAQDALAYADAALLAYEKRWEEEGKEGAN